MFWSVGVNRDLSLVLAPSPLTCIRPFATCIPQGEQVEGFVFGGGSAKHACGACDWVCCLVLRGGKIHYPIERVCRYVDWVMK